MKTMICITPTDQNDTTDRGGKTRHQMNRLSGGHRNEL